MDPAMQYFFAVGCKGEIDADKQWEAAKCKNVSVIATPLYRVCAA